VPQPRGVSVRAVDGCGCKSGGFDGVANRRHLKTVRARIRAFHRDTHCLAVGSSNPACFGVMPYCHDGVCRLVRRN
jgi:hypothetical protein